ncbi:hypothetical protein K8R03_04515 [Candidatus Kaiserbacteria bacterium]|nr:hypothetical protein [Candidatus Kaiserbacteria bacterium]
MARLRQALRWALGTLGMLLLLVVFFSTIVLLVAYGFRGECSVPEHQNVSVQPSNRTDLAAVPGYVRPGKTTYLTFPEWYIVYSAREYAAYLSMPADPSSFEYFRSVGRFWCGYRAVNAELSPDSGKTFMDTVMLFVIGGSYSVEYTVKGGYEATLGRVSELIGGADTPEDRFYAAYADSYARFLDETPWYDYPFGTTFVHFWETPTRCPLNLRSCERRIVYSVEFLLKTAYAHGIAYATHASYTPANLTTMLLVSNVPGALADDGRIRVVQTFEDGPAIIEVPRYQEFTRLMRELASARANILDFAGNDGIVVSVIVPPGEHYGVVEGTIFLTMSTASDRGQRLLLEVPAKDFSAFIRHTLSHGYTLEHVYDY